MRGSGRLVASAVALATIFILASPVTALANKPKTPTRIGHSIVLEVSGNGSSIVLTANPAVKDKAGYDPIPDEAAAGASGGMLSTYDSDGCGWPSCNPAKLGNSRYRWISPPGGSAQNIYVRFSSTDPWCVPEFCVTFSGNSYAAWLGANPWNPDQMDLWDHWHVDALMPSVGYPSGISVTGSGGDAYWSRTKSGTWNLSHSFDNIKFSAWDIWNITEYVGGDFDFGNSTFSTQTDDSCLV
jgi:hypothetical protein